MDWQGHKSEQTTKRYAHLSTNHKSELTERVMSEVFAGENQLILMHWILYKSCYYWYGCLVKHFM